MKKIIKTIVPSVAISIAAYCLVSLVKRSPSLPSIMLILKSAKNILISKTFYLNLLYTLKIVTSGVMISFAIGFAIAVLCSYNKAVSGIIMPIINSTKNIPSIALFPLFIILMGIGDMPRIFVIIWNSMYPIISSTMSGIRSVPTDTVEAAMNCGASKIQLYRYIKIPLSLLDTLNGLKIAMGNGFIAIVVAEMLGATKGLGYMVLWSANTFKYSDMYVYILVIAFIGFLINVVIDRIILTVERKMFYENGKEDH